jgi:hypothetical protein
MKRAFLLFAAALLSMTFFARSAWAKFGDKAWVQCVWETAPQSATKWLSLPLPTWQTSEKSTNVLLGYRLMALCDATSVEVSKNKIPSWKSVADVLAHSRPEGGAAQKPPQAEALLCESKIAGDSFVYLYDVVRRLGGSDMIVSRQYYVDDHERPVKLPRDLSIAPKEGQKIERACHIIGPEGELTDA